MEHINVNSLKEWLDSEKSIFLLDVRESWEFDHCKIPGSVNIPLSEIQQKITDIDDKQSVVLICHHGARSFNAGMFLESTGAQCQFYNLEGGIDAWSEQIDNSVPRY